MSLDEGSNSWGPGGGPVEKDAFEKIRREAAEKKKAVGQTGVRKSNDVVDDGGPSPYSADPQDIVEQAEKWRRNWSTPGPGGLTDDVKRSYAEAVNRGQVVEGDDLGPNTIKLRLDEQNQDYDARLLTALWRDPRTELEFVRDIDNGDRVVFRRKALVGVTYDVVVIKVDELNEAAAKSFQEYRRERSGKPLKINSPTNEWTRARFLDQFSRFRVDTPDKESVAIAAKNIKIYGQDYSIARMAKK